MFFRRKPTLPHTTIAIYLRTKTDSKFEEMIFRPFVINFKSIEQDAKETSFMI